MSPIRTDIRTLVRQGNRILGRVIDVTADGHASVSLSKNGAVYKSLPIVGGPVKINQIVAVDFTTSIPTITAPGVTPETGTPVDESRKRARKSPMNPTKGDPTDYSLICVYDGPDPRVGRPPGAAKSTYPVTEAGLFDALEFASSGDVVYLPICDIQGDPETRGWPLGSHIYSTSGSPTFQFKDNITLAGTSQSTSKLIGSLLIGDRCHVRDLQINAGSVPVSGTELIICATVIGDCDFNNVKMTATGTGGHEGVCIQNWYTARVILNNCSLIASDDCIRGESPVECDIHARIWGTNWPAIHTYPNQNTGGTMVFWGENYSFGQWDTQPLAWSYGNGYYLRDAFYWQIFGSAQVVPEGTYLWVDFKVASVTDENGDETTAESANLEIMDFTHYGNPPYIEWPGFIIPDSQTGFYQFVNGVSSQAYHAGDTVQWKIDYYSSGSPANFPNILYLAMGRYIDDNLVKGTIVGVPQIYLQYPDGRKVYLEYVKGYWYINNCVLSAGGLQIHMDYYNIAYLAGTQIISWDGDVVFTQNGEMAVLVSEDEPGATFPGMFWLKE